MTRWQWRGIAAAGALGLALGGCGGGGGDSDPPASTADTTAPVVSLTASAQSVEPGVNVSFTLSATDAKDGSLTPTLTCTAGVVQGNTLSTSTVAANTDIQCTATATDAAGNRGTTSQTIHVIPSPSRLDLPAELANLAPSEVGLLFATGVTLDQPTYQGTIGGTPVTLERAGAGLLAFVVPATAQSGSRTLEVTIAGRSYTKEIAVTAAPVIADPAAVVRDTLNEALARIDEVIAGGTAGMEPAAITKLNNDRTNLAAAIADLNSYSAADLQSVAAYFVANGLADSTAATGFGPRPAKFNAEQCWDSAQTFKKKNIKTIVAATLSLGTGMYGLATANPLMLAVSAVAGIRAYSDWDATMEEIDRVIDLCLDESELVMVDESVEEFQDGRKFDRAESKPLDVALGFTNNKPRKFRIEHTLTMDDDVIASMQAAFAQIADAVAKLPYVPEPISNMLEKLKTEVTETLPAAAFSLGAPSRGDITGTKSSSGDSLLLTFKAIEPTEENIDFTFKLTRGDGDPITVAARLMIDLPEAENASIIVTQGKAMQSSVVVRGADTLEVMQSPAHGSVTLEDDGTFAYQPSGQYFGADTFTYRARNENGTSKPATVTIDVQRKFEGAWHVTAVAHTTAESSTGLCSSEDGTTTATYSITKISPTQYSVAVTDEHNLSLTMPSADSPGGLSGSLTVQYPDGPNDEGTSTETLSLSVPNSSELSGTTSWSYSYSKNGTSASCSGTTQITGTR